jgi:hypothetical protein
MIRIFKDDFEDILRFESSQTNATALLQIVDTLTFEGSGCLRILNTDATPTDGGHITASTKAMLTENKKYRLLGEVKFGTKTNLKYLAIQLEIIIEGYKYYAGLRYDVQNNKIQYTAEDGTYIEASDRGVTILANQWVSFEIVCNIGNAKMEGISFAGFPVELNTNLSGATKSTYDRNCTLSVIGTQEGTTAGFEIWLDHIELEGE